MPIGLETTNASSKVTSSQDDRRSDAPSVQSWCRPGHRLHATAQRDTLNDLPGIFVLMRLSPNTERDNNS